MPDEWSPVNASTLDFKSLLKELELPLLCQSGAWRVTNTAKDRKRGQVVPYADARAYADRLNALFTPQGGLENTVSKPWAMSRESNTARASSLARF